MKRENITVKKRLVDLLGSNNKSGIYVIEKESRSISKKIDNVISSEEKLKQDLEIQTKIKEIITEYPHIGDFIENNKNIISGIEEDLIDLGKQVGDNIGDLFQYGIPAVMSFVQENPSLWPQFVELGKQDGKNIGYLFKYGIPAVIPLIKEKPDLWLQFVDLGKQAGDNIIYLFQYGIPEIMPFIKEKDSNKWILFLKQNVDSKNNIKILSKLSKLSNINNLDIILSYYINYKQKSLINLIQKLLISNGIGLSTNYNQITEMMDLSFLDLNDEEREDLKSKDREKLNVAKNKIRVKKEKIISLMNKLLEITNFSQKNKKKQELSTFLKGVLEFDDKNKELLKKIFADVIILYFNIIFDRKLETKLKVEFGQDIEFIDDILELASKEIFEEAFAMYKSTKINKIQFKIILLNYLKGKNGFVYGLPKNKEWIEFQRNKNKISNIDLWKERNEKIINIGENSRNEQEISRNINYYFNISISKLRELGLKDNFKNFGELLFYFDTEIKKNKEQLKKESNLLSEKFDDLFNDLELQISFIKETNKQCKSKQITRIKIYKEQDPLRVLMMGNWVDDSCLSYYNNAWTGNYGTIPTNALDINKGLFYIEDQNGNIIGRVLTAVDDYGKILRFVVYKSGNIGIDLDKYFNEYIKELANKIGFGIGGNIEKVSLLNGEKWYKDPVYNIY